jgi:hypothetical protein
VKAKTVEYFKTISIPGVSKIVTTESYLIKLLWTVVILGVFGFGVFIISQAVADFYKYDKITNIERVNPENVTFPAIIICRREWYWREHYRNGSLIKRDIVSTNLLKKFLDFEITNFYSFTKKLSVNNHIDTFKINNRNNLFLLDCLRFNAATNKTVELFKTDSIENTLLIYFKYVYKEDISNVEYYRHSFFDSDFYVYVGDNYLNSFENLKYLELKSGSANEFLIEKISTETKLPEPYNPCKKSSVDEPYHQMDCIEACTYKEIKNRYNCTFHSTLILIQGLKQCELNYKKLIAEFSASCLKECPLESCFSENFYFSYTQIRLLPYNYTFFRFSFRDLGTLNISQIPKTDPFTFLNNIGGGLGLFMGIAIPNLIEFSQFILEIVLIIFNRKIN